MSNEQEKPKPQRLTMKLLNERIGELQAENGSLTHRIDELEKQWDEFMQAQLQAAAAVQSSVPYEPEAADVTETHMVEAEMLQEACPQELIPRSQRHYTPKKKLFFKSLWPRLWLLYPSLTLRIWL